MRRGGESLGNRHIVNKTIGSARLGIKVTILHAKLPKAPQYILSKNTAVNV